MNETTVKEKTYEVPPIVVGVDGSDESWQAIHAAAWEARARRLPLVLAHGYPADPYTWYGWAPMYVGPPYDPRAGASAMVEETANEVRANYPDLAVDTELHVGTGAHALITAAGHATMVVVGSRGGGGFAGLSIGSVAAQTAAHATCPVLVIRPSDKQAPAEPGTARAPRVDLPRPVLVGVDGSSTSDSAIEFAFAEAELRGVALIAVYVWWLLPTHNLGPDLPGRQHLDDAQEEARRLLSEMMAGWTAKFPDLPVQLRAVQSMNPSHELIEASRDAGLVVVGSRGRGGFTGLLLGSVGRDLVGHAHCPVAVVHPAVPH
ncbi:MAG TPA: universal stress protein [Micromonosporaceae bacterium]|jgi:nucleotide-binding universal stress UspA family protein